MRDLEGICEGEKRGSERRKLFRRNWSVGLWSRKKRKDEKNGEHKRRQGGRKIWKGYRKRKVVETEEEEIKYIYS